MVRLHKIAIITGVNSGLGVATAKKLCDEGGNTFIMDSNKEKTEAACGTIEANAIRVIFDLNHLTGIPEMRESHLKLLQN